MKLSYKQISFMELIVIGQGQHVGNTNPTALALERRGLITTEPGRGLNMLCTLTDKCRRLLLGKVAHGEENKQ